MIYASDVARICVTRGDVPLPRTFGMTAENILWDNAMTAEDMGVYGRYAALDLTDKPVVLVQDDDVELPPDTVMALLQAYVPKQIICNMPREYRERYTAHCLLGFGSIFDKDLPEKAFARFRAKHPLTDEQFFRRTCDVAFTALTPFTPVDFPFTMLPHTRAENRMYRQPNHSLERRRMLELAKQAK